MTLDHGLRVLPGHTVETTIGREWERNPFVRFWRGLDEEVGTPCTVGGVAGVVVVESPDYDGKGKLLVRLDGGEERIVGASRVELQGLAPRCLTAASSAVTDARDRRCGRRA